MGFPLGSAPLADGTGTSPTDMQRIIGSMYHNAGIIPGSSVGGVVGTTSMAYKVDPCTVFTWSNSAAKLGLLVPVEAATVQTDPAPSTGTRTDFIYVDSAGAIRVKMGGVAPAGVILGQFVVPAGAVSTQSIPNIADRTFAVPAGASLSRLHKFHDPANGIKGNEAPLQLGTGRFVLPSDRIVRFDLTHCISAAQDTDPVNESATMRWRVYIDDVLELAFTTRVTWMAPQTNFLSFTKELSEGEHRVHYVQDQIEGVGNGLGWTHHKGTAAGYPGNRFEVWDVGVAR